MTSGTFHGLQLIDFPGGLDVPHLDFNFTPWKSLQQFDFFANMSILFSYILVEASETLESDIGLHLSKRNAEIWSELLHQLKVLKHIIIRSDWPIEVTSTMSS